MKITIQRNSSIIFLLLITILTVFQACKKSRSDIGALVFKQTRNKVFKDIQADVFADKLKAAIQTRKSGLKNPKFMEAIYADHNFEAIMLDKHLADSGLVVAAEVIARAGEHGLDPATFKSKELSALITKIYDKEAIKNTDQAYETLVALELSAASSLTDYANALQFGVVSPRRIFAQYYTSTKRPDSISFARPFETKDIKSFLDSVQPTSDAYKALQKALQDKVVAPGLGQEETMRILQVNLERLRWQNGPGDEKYVWVNIPDFTLDVMEKQKSVLHMKVCVGEGRNLSGQPTLIEYDESDLEKDRPFNRETPQLNSKIHSVQVNPVWNIPESIATNEISKYAAKDRYYLANNNIDLFLKGKKVEDTETIDWSDANAGKMYTFKQRPGDDNSLGKIKFLFNNQSSVYLHDTPAKAAFKQNNRAVSHGCVRVEQPLELARALFGEGAKFEKIKSEMESKDPKAQDIGLPTQVPVYLAYMTCWRDQAGTLQFRKDIYGLDVVLYSYLSKA